MIYVYPKKNRPVWLRYVLWLPLMVEVYFLHHKNGWKYAAHWANESLSVPKVFGPV